MAFLTVNNVSKRGRDGFSVQNFSFSQAPLEKTAIAGETGSGKTTLLKLLAGLEQPDGGEMRFLDKKIIGPLDQLIPGHPGIAYMSQYFELRNNYWVHEVLEYANKLPETAAKELYEVCRIEQLLNRRTNQLSGGEKQRVALARLLICAPKLLLLDEPFSNLDAIHRGIIKAVLDDITERLQVTYIIISHDATDILSWADTIMIMKDGALVQKGSPQDIYFRPLNTYCAGLFGPYNLIDKKLAMRLDPVNKPGVNQKQMLVRPEHFTLAAAGHHALRGIVEKIWFWGSCYTADVLVEDQLISLNINPAVVNVGDEIDLALQPGKSCWV